MTPVQLEAWARRALACLDPPEAPPTLLPSILERVQTMQSSSWHRRSWRGWSTGLRVSLGLLCAATAALVTIVWPTLIAADVPALADAAVLCLRLIAQSGAMYVAVPIGLMVLTSALLLIALARVIGEGVPSHERL